MEKSVTQADVLDNVQELLRKFGVIEADPSVFWGSISPDMTNGYRHISEEMARYDLALGLRVFRVELTRDPHDENGVQVELQELK